MKDRISKLEQLVQTQGALLQKLEPLLALDPDTAVLRHLVRAVKDDPQWAEINSKAADVEVPADARKPSAIPEIRDEDFDFTGQLMYIVDLLQSGDPAKAADIGGAVYELEAKYAQALKILDTIPHGDKSLDQMQAMVNEQNAELEKRRVLLCEGRDLRNVGCTLRCAEQSGTTQRIDFHFHDSQPEVIARCLMTLHALRTRGGDLAETKLATYVAQLTYSQELDPRVASFWDTVMLSCLEHDWFGATATVRVRDESTLEQVQRCWRAWLAVDWTTAELDEHRAKATPDYSVVDLDGHDNRAEYARIHELHNRSLLEDDERCVNPTMLHVRHDESVTYMVAPDLRPFRAFSVDFDGATRDSSMLIEIQDWLGAIRRCLCARPNSPSFTFGLPPGTVLSTITFGCRNAMEYLEELIADVDCRFDAIDATALVNDHGLLNTLINGSPLLNDRTYRNRSLLFTACQTEHTRNHQDYLHFATALPLDLFPTLFGLSASPYVLDSLKLCVKALLLERSAMVQQPACVFTTAAFFPKLLAFAFAAGRLTWSSSAAYTSLPWPAMPDLWRDIESSVSKTRLPELIAQAQLYGFPIEHELADPSSVCRLECDS
ncbi:hypothetical protein H9P43_008806 [Blastocladiella emersonii ATCC 22665]|nr:hypothetical protein H9P43_008806 [Blastocladiella emersonii ATCC 22665]